MSSDDSDSKLVTHFVERIVGPSADALGGMLQDQLKSFRAQNLERLHKKWKIIREDKGISEAAIKVLPFGDAFRVLEASSMEEDENVQNIWAQLLASATDSKRDVTIEKRFINLLKSLSGNDAIILNIFIDSMITLPPIASSDEEKIIYKDFNSDVGERVKMIKRAQALISIQNLTRLGVISYVATYNDSFGDIPKSLGINEHVRSLDKEQIADSLIEILDIINTVSGWSENRIFDDLHTDEVILTAVDKYELTPFGFDLLKICSND